MNEAEKPVPRPLTNVRDLMPVLYDELRRLAEKSMRAGPDEHLTLQPTAIVHEVFLRMSHYSADQLFETRRQFYFAAAESMRQFLIEYQRRKNAGKRGGMMRRIHIALDAVEDPLTPTFDIIELDEALRDLAAIEPEKSELVKLRYFCGLTIAEAAETLDISTATADRWWAFSKAYLALKLDL